MATSHHTRPAPGDEGVPRRDGAGGATSLPLDGEGGSQPASASALAQVPEWLTRPQAYEPTGGRDNFLTRSFLSVSGVLAQLRLDDGRAAPWSPSAGVKLVFALACVVLVSLSRNLLFVGVVLAGVLVRACLLPSRALRRVVGVALGSAALVAALSAPAALLGQPRSALTLATKALACSGLVMEVALSTPPGELSVGLRALRVPDVAILTFELALRSIVGLGTVALEALDALRLRSVGANRDGAGSIGGVGGVVFVKAAEASRQTYDAMRCRGFTGTYEHRDRVAPQRADLPWLALLGALVALFARLG